jgi:hypothetical protein
VMISIDHKILGSPLFSLFTILGITKGNVSLGHFQLFW